MSSNLRSRPIEGHITDSAGNVIRNAQIIIQSQTPNGSFIVDSPLSDESGYFISKPISSGEYDIYESGIRVAHLAHQFNIPKIQCFKADRDNYDSSTVPDFLTLADSSELNKFKMFIQIESDRIDISQYGNSFPLYDYDIASLTDESNELFHIAKFLDMVSGSSLITTTRFDVEYYSPMTAINNFYKRIRWAGVPAVRFGLDSKLVIPLDYFSIVESLPKIFTPISIAEYNPDDVSFELSEGDILTLSAEESVAEFVTLYDNVTIGDIIQVQLKDTSLNIRLWNGIVVEKTTSTNRQMVLERWRSSRFLSYTGSLTELHIIKLNAYDGMFQGLISINEDVNEFFTVTENTTAQNNGSELYNYNSRYV